MAKQYLDEEGLQLYDDMIKKVISNQSENIVQKTNYLLFPTVGDSNLLYVDTENNTVYRWDSSMMKYFCIGNKYSDIDVISGGSSK